MISPSSPMCETAPLYYSNMYLYYCSRMNDSLTLAALLFLGFCTHAPFLSMPHADSSLVPENMGTKPEFWNHVHSQVLALVDGQTSWVRSIGNVIPTACGLIFIPGKQFGQHFLLGLSLDDGL